MKLPFLRHPLLRRVEPEPPPWADGLGEPELAALRASRPRRLARLDTLLRPAGIDLRGEPLAAVQALDQWTRITWPDLIRRAWVRRGIDPWTDWQRATGEQAAAYTHAMDVAVALGELALRAAPAFAWGVDAFDDHIADGDSLVGRAVLLDPALPADAADPPVCSPIDLVVLRFQATGARDFPDPPFVAGLGPVWWRDLRHLYVGPDRLDTGDD